MAFTPLPTQLKDIKPPQDSMIFSNAIVLLLLGRKVMSTLPSPPISLATGPPVLSLVPSVAFLTSETEKWDSKSDSGVLHVSRVFPDFGDVEVDTIHREESIVASSMEVGGEGTRIHLWGGWVSERTGSEWASFLLHSEPMTLCRGRRRCQLSRKRGQSNGGRTPRAPSAMPGRR